VSFYIKVSDLYYIFKGLSVQLLFYYYHAEIRFAAKQDLKELKRKFNQIILKIH